MDLALLIVRIALGLGIAAHGAQKLFGWFTGYGLKGMAGFMESSGYRPGILFAALAGLGEFGGGLLVALGLGGPIGPATIIAVMLVAVWMVHRGKGFFATNNGFELPMTYAVGALALAFVGFGELSLDSLLGLTRVWTERFAWLCVGLAIVAAAGTVAAKRAPLQVQAQAKA